MNSLIIANGAAGQRNGDDLSSELRNAFGAEMPRLVQTKGPGDAQSLALDAARSGNYRFIYAVGGDGTINEVASGLLAGSDVNSRPILGIIPRGTCNVLASELGIPMPGIAEAVDVLRNGCVKNVDVGRAGDRYFLMSVSCGVDAEAVRDVALPLKNLVGAGAYLMSGLTALANYTPSRVTIRYDQESLSLDAFVVIVANLSTYALSSITVAPFAAIDDGWLDICIFEKPPTHRIGFIAQVMLLLARRHLGDPRVRYLRAKRIEIQSDPPIAAQLDGDPIGQTPLTIEVVPRALPILVPAALV